METLTTRVETGELTGMVTPQQLRSKRMALGLSGRLVCGRARIGRTRLSDVEQGLVEPRPDELERISTALEQLATAKSRLQQVAAEVGWPEGAL